MTIANCDNGHDMKQVGYTAPTCQTIGAKVYTCSRCGYTETETLFPIDCDYQLKSATPSTCTEHGSEIYECTMCHTPKAETLPLKDHNYVHQSTTSPTCLLFGKTTETCSGCGDEKTTYDNTIRAHRFSSSGYCMNCGISEYYFDTDLHFSRFFDEISIRLTPVFNNSNKNTADHWAAHTVSVTITLYRQYANEPCEVLQCDSATDTKCFWSAENEDHTTPLHFSANLVNQVRYLDRCTITISCEGFKPISQTYTVQ